MIDYERISRQMAMKNKPRIIWDFETRSRAKLGKAKDAVGAWKYAMHSSTRVLCASWKIKYPDGKVTPGKAWRAWKGEPFPQEVADLIAKGCVVEAHNAQFERAIFTHVISRDYPDVPLPKYYACTMAACAYRALPMDLGDVGSVLNLTTQKNKRGTFLIRKLCQPQKITKKNKDEWCDDGVLLEELTDYCVTDSEAEYQVGEALHDLPDDEYEVWCLDAKINERGVYVDIEALHAALKIREEVFTKLNAELRVLTNNAAETADELAKIKEWCASKNLFLDDMTADTIEEVVQRLDKIVKNPGDRDDAEMADVILCHKVLKIRQTLGKASTKKLDRFIHWCMNDNRIRGMLQYYGASTGRWAGRGVQPQNFPRPEERLMFDSSKHVHDGMDKLIEVIRHGDAELLELIYGDPMEAMASALRGFLMAAPGNELYVADFSAIEARVLAWVAGEQWKLDAFAGIDRGEGFHGSEDIYLATASTVYGYPCLKKATHAKERQTGKTCELAFGYQGGVGAWRKFDDSDKYSDDEVDEIKKKWRHGHPMVVKFWYGVEDAAVRAVMMKTTTHFRDITYAYVQSDVGPWLACRLPNGRCLWYFNPQIEEAGTNQRTGETKYQVSYEGKDNKRNGVWGRIRTYGGMLTENIVQAISRDLMVDAMFRVEKAGYPIVLTVHDEIISERTIGEGDIELFNDLMAELPDWVKKNPIHLPIAVAGWHGVRYHKE